MTFKSPLLLLLVPLFIFAVFLLRRMSSPRGFLFPTDEIIKRSRGGLKLWLVKNLVYLRILCILLVLVAMARPQVSREAPVKKMGIAVILAIDCSSTMLADDLQLDLQALREGNVKRGQKSIRRIDAVKSVAGDFVKARPDNLIGIVAFASEAFVICPLTFHHEWMLSTLDRVQVGLIKDGTAVGSGILSSLNTLRDSKAKSKVVILLTDGINNFGKIPPLVAAKAARAMGVKIYTVGLVSKGQELTAADDWSGRKVYKRKKIQVEEGDLREIAKLTGGKYYRATDLASLRNSYKEIDRLEKVSIEEKTYEEYVDIFQNFLFPALALLLLEILLSNTFLRKIP